MILVIGYGNPLRGDDGVGPAVVNGLDRGDGIDLITAPMLVPELAEPIARASSVIFVDARVGPEAGAVQCDTIVPGSDRHALGHVASPEGLLGLAEALYDHRPQAFVVSVTGDDFDVRPALSEAVRRAVPEALRIVGELIERLQRTGLQA